MTDDLPDITLGEACEEIRQLHKAGERLRAENERLLRERDEALALAGARAAATKVFAIDAKEARAKAIDEAAAVANHWLGPDSYCEAAILALREKP
jgi:hypothetical protein